MCEEASDVYVGGEKSRWVNREWDCDINLEGEPKLVERRMGGIPVC